MKAPKLYNLVCYVDGQPCGPHTCGSCERSQQMVIAKRERRV